VLFKAREGVCSQLGGSGVGMIVIVIVIGIVRKSLLMSSALAVDCCDCDSWRGKVVAEDWGWSQFFFCKVILVFAVVGIVIFGIKVIVGGVSALAGFGLLSCWVVVWSVSPRGQEWRMLHCSSSRLMQEGDSRGVSSVVVVVVIIMLSLLLHGG